MVASGKRTAAISPPRSTRDASHPHLPRCQSRPCTVNGLLASEPRKKRKQRRFQAVVMDHIVIRKHRMGGAQQRMDGGFEVLRADGRQAQHPHAVVRGPGGSEILPAIDGYFMPQTRQFVSGLFVIGFNPAVFRYDATSADERHANASSRPRALRSASKDRTFLLEMSR